MGAGASGCPLLAALVAQAQDTGVRKLIAMIGDSAIAASIGLHRRLGFEPVGTIRSCGRKFDRWLGIVPMEKAQGNGDRTAPAAQ
jgi:L-amino acid N-acyltransferase YncA